MGEGYKDIETIETEGYKAGSEFGLKSIIYKQLQRCIDEGSKEMTGGGTITRIIDGRPISIAVPNQREIYINSCEHLKILLLKHITDNLDKIEDFIKVKDFVKNFDGEEVKLKKEHMAKIDKAYKEFLAYSFKVQYKFESMFNVNLQRVNDMFEIRLVDMYKVNFLKIIPYLLAKTNFFGED